ncbi:MAG: response regulator [Fimbriimonadales bacterium]|jgi:response regulator NasT|nr:response regulator [Fimbriimonadales bacterium]GBC91208.1 putative transcriptional regulatory protein pdtaR [bacterium HR14]GIV14080.1 MAG: Fis family transcriptional regulator [Fimbriimonadales bacterium]CUU09601.1 response regulator receiver and ANTAR domain protein [Armatimonadetes bacterium GBS]CUU35174.1 response regulator receiver and ANTAR domain protein [Armatimonadetes bacterium GXS]
MNTYRVLIVDDEPVIRMDLRAMLESMGHTVVGEADNGETALALARTLQPDLVIVDIMMPGMDGIELSRRLAKERIAPVLILTAYSEQAMIEGADKAGVLGYLVKPFREADLAPAIQVAVSRYREMRAIEAQMLNLEREMKARKTIGRARRVLAQKLGISEDEAFRRMVNTAESTGKPLVEVAEAVLLAHQVEPEQD